MSRVQTEEESVLDKPDFEQDPPARAGPAGIPVPQFSELPAGPGDVNKNFHEEGGIGEEHLVKECPPAFLNETFSPSVTVVEADGSGMIVLKDNWRVETLENGTKMSIDHSSATWRKISPPLYIPGAAMV
jgi:hypothetical protein